MGRARINKIWVLKDKISTLKRSYKIKVTQIIMKTFIILFILEAFWYFQIDSPKRMLLIGGPAALFALMYVVEAIKDLKAQLKKAIFKIEDEIKNLK